MAQYKETCPNCGTENKNLYLEETEGRYICENCMKLQQSKKITPINRVPLLTSQQMAVLARR